MDKKEFRHPPEGVYRLIELKERVLDGFGSDVPKEEDITRHIDDFTDWDEAVAALRSPKAGHRRQLWGHRGILGVHGAHQSFVFETFK